MREVRGGQYSERPLEWGWGQGHLWDELEVKGNGKSQELFTVTLRLLALGVIKSETATPYNQVRLSMKRSGHHPSYNTLDQQFVLPTAWKDGTELEARANQ